MSDRRKKTLIVPVFIPYQGCPHRCVFCEQEKITSEPQRKIDRTNVTEILEAAVRSRGFDPDQGPEIAFYGGTFTGLPVNYMKDLLAAAAPFVAKGLFCGIRVSTRPDAVDEERLGILKEHRVLTVELGAQSMDDRVLELSNRGHTAADTRDATTRLKRHGFKVGMQLMPGLPGDTHEGFVATIAQVLALKPDMVRLYPAVVIQGTGLAQLYEKGIFHPLTLDAAVGICAEACMRLEQAGIPVIRMGLMSSPELLKCGRILAGPWHPAFGFLVRSEIYHRNIRALVPRTQTGGTIRITMAGNDIPLLRGHKNQGIERLKRVTGAARIMIRTDDHLDRGHITMENL